MEFWSIVMRTYMKEISKMERSLDLGKLNTQMEMSTSENLHSISSMEEYLFQFTFSISRDNIPIRMEMCMLESLKAVGDPDKEFSNMQMGIVIQV